MAAVRGMPPISIQYQHLKYYQMEPRSSQVGHQRLLHSYGFVSDQSLHISLELGVDQPMAGVVQSGQMFYIPPECTYTLTNDHGEPMDVILFCFRLETVEDGGQELKLWDQTLENQLMGVYSPYLRNWVQEQLFHDLLSKHAVDDRVYCSLSHISPEEYALYQALLYAMTRTWLTRYKTKPNRSVFEMIMQTKQYMQEHFEQLKDIDEVVRFSGSSASRFYHEFRLVTGLSPHKFMTRTRLEASLNYLANSDLSIKEVAHTVGYADEFYFSRLFRKHMQLSPSEYAKLARRRVANLCPVFTGDFAVLGMSPCYTAQRGWVERPEAVVKALERLQPEMILTPPIPDELYTRLSQIAPVTMLHWKGIPWKQRLIEIAAQMELQSVAAWWLGLFADKVENTRELIRERWDKKACLLVGVYLDGYRVFGPQRNKLSDLFYGELDIIPAKGTKQIGFLDTTQLEEIVQLSEEHVLFFVDPAISASDCKQLERAWQAYCQQLGRDDGCTWFRIGQPVHYNPVVYERLLDQFTTNLLK